jgi:hypothetical protein
MDDRLLKRYREYASTEEAFAVLLVKKHLSEAKGYWIDVVDCRRYEMSPDNIHFRFVVGGLFKRKIQPKYRHGLLIPSMASLMSALTT